MTTSPEPRHLVITGLMGVGKTTTADAVGGALGRDVRDSDRDIERLFGQTGAELAAAHGVDELHRIEAAMLLGALAATEPAVIAAAGWIVEDPLCRQALRRRSITVVLAAPTAELVRRSASGRHRRPVDASEFEAQAARRAAWFEEVADLVVDATDAEESVAARVIALLERPVG